MRGIILSMAAMATRLGNGLDISFMAKVAFMAMIQGSPILNCRNLEFGVEHYQTISKFVSILN